MASARAGEALPVRTATVAETLARYGPESLSDAQIVEALLNRPLPGRAEALLQQAGGIGPLVALGPSDLAALGLSKAEMARFGVLPEVQRRSTRGRNRPRLLAPRTAGAFLLQRVQGWTEERFGMIALNARGALLADRILAQGTATACLISPRVVFREALHYGASSALAWPSHPSGDPSPSRGESLGVPLADHVVLGFDSFHSFRATERW
jgi:DNA repair protein RadC